jgi:hypothetical protein
LPELDRREERVVHHRMFATGSALIIGCATPVVIDAALHNATAQAQRHADNQTAEQLQLARELPPNVERTSLRRARTDGNRPVGITGIGDRRDEVRDGSRDAAPTLGA